MANKLFQYAKRRIQAAIEARYTGYSIEKHYSDYIIFRYAGQWLFILDGQSPDTLKIVHENASFYSRSAFAAEFTEKYHIDDMMASKFGKGRPKKAKIKRDKDAKGYERPRVNDIEKYPNAPRI